MYIENLSWNPPQVAFSRGHHLGQGILILRLINNDCELEATQEPKNAPIISVGACGDQVIQYLLIWALSIMDLGWWHTADPFQSHSRNVYVYVYWIPSSLLSLNPSPKSWTKSKTTFLGEMAEICDNLQRLERWSVGIYIISSLNSTIGLVPKRKGHAGWLWIIINLMPITTLFWVLYHY